MRHIKQIHTNQQINVMNYMRIVLHGYREEI